MMAESGIMDGQHQNKVYRLSAFFSPSGHARLVSLADFMRTCKARENKLGIDYKIGPA